VLNNHSAAHTILFEGISVSLARPTVYSGQNLKGYFLEKAKIERIPDIKKGHQS
jgi:hypothetical protein